MTKQKNLTYVLDKIRNEYNCSLTCIKGRQILFQGEIGDKKIVVCTPYSKNYKNGNGWFDLTKKQVALLDDSDIAILAARVEGNNIYYINFKNLRLLLTEDIVINNIREGDHWKLRIYDTYIKIQGSDKIFHFSQSDLITLRGVTSRATSKYPLCHYLACKILASSNSIHNLD